MTKASAQKLKKQNTRTSQAKKGGNLIKSVCDVEHGLLSPVNRINVKLKRTILAMQNKYQDLTVDVDRLTACMDGLREASIIENNATQLVSALAALEPKTNDEMEHMVIRQPMTLARAALHKHIKMVKGTFNSQAKWDDMAPRL